jgi:hypothetical protein
MRSAAQAAAAAVLALLATGGGATAAQAAVADDPGTTWDTASVTTEYGEYWALSATSPNAGFLFGPWKVTGSLSGAPSGYAVNAFGYETLPGVYSSILQPASDGRPLPAGTYTGTITLTESDGTGPAYPSPPATLTVAPAALTVALAVTADPSNPSNAIVSAALTGAFRDNFYTTTFAEGPLTPAGAWRIEVTGEDGEVVHELDATRADTDDIMAVSTYWSDVAPGAYSVRATFTSSGASAQNFAITQAQAVTYTAAPAPGATSTATPAPPAPPPAADESGLTLPGWIPLVAGVLSAGLLALLIVQIVRLRRSGAQGAAFAAQGSDA